MIIATEPRILLPKTGQTTSYRTGDDGQVQAGCPILIGAAPGNRFETNGNIAIDHVNALAYVRETPKIKPGGTGQETLSAQGTWSAAHGTYNVDDLVVGDGSPDALYYICILQHTAAADKEPPNGTYWVVTPWTASAADLTTPATMDWNNAIDNCVGLTYDGVGPWSATNPYGWRLPNGIELLALGDVSQNPAIVSVMPNVTAGWSYWSGTTRTLTTTQAVEVSYFTDRVYHSTLAKTNTKYVRPVRTLPDFAKI